MALCTLSIPGQNFPGKEDISSSAQASIECIKDYRQQQSAAVNLSVALCMNSNWTLQLKRPFCFSIIEPPSKVPCYDDETLFLKPFDAVPLGILSSSLLFSAGIKIVQIKIYSKEKGLQRLPAMERVS